MKKIIQQSAQNTLTILQNKFQKLKEIQDSLAKIRPLYKEHDIIMSELLPLFIETTSDTFTVRRSITIGTRTYRFTPFFYDEKKSEVIPKVWKATAHEAGRIEA